MISDCGIENIEPKQQVFASSHFCSKMAGRQMYSHEDDVAMWQYLHQQMMLHNEHAFSPMGLEIWKCAAAAGITNKTVQSMTCHFRRKLWPDVLKAPLPRADLQFLLDKWPFASHIQLRDNSQDSSVAIAIAAIEEFEESNSSDDVTVENIDVQMRPEEKSQRRPPIKSRKRPTNKPSEWLDSFSVRPSTPKRQVESSSLLPGSSNQAEAMSIATTSVTEKRVNRPFLNGDWFEVDANEQRRVKEALVAIKDKDIPYSDDEHFSLDSVEFRSTLMAHTRQGAIQADQIEAVEKQTRYLIFLAKKFNVSLSVVLGMLIADEEYRDLRKLRAVLETKKERAVSPTVDNRQTQTETEENCGQFVNINAS